MINISHKQKFIFELNEVCMIKYKRKLLFYHLGSAGIMRSTPFTIVNIESYINHVNDLFDRQHIKVNIYNELITFLC